MARRSFIVAVVSLLIIGVLCHSGCRKRTDPLLSRFTIISQIKEDPESPFYIDFLKYPKTRQLLPIGIFDSGTGGLTVLNALLRADGYNNQTREPGTDHFADFERESFVYLGDKANMPYGSYNSEGKSDFLKELIIKDVQFLLNRKYYRSPVDQHPKKDKIPVKVIVIACNTATAFGLEIVKKSLREWGLDIGVIGIIDAGAEAAVESMGKNHMDRVVGVLATEGTCATNGYPKALKKYYFNAYKTGDITVCQQAGFGLAAAIDGDINYIDSAATMPRGKDRYLGPCLDHPRYPIDPSLWEHYNFVDGEQLLVNRDLKGKLTAVEINSVDNYIRYHVTHLVVRMDGEKTGGKLQSVILGCTHYPYFKEEIMAHFRYLRSLNSRYRDLIPENLVIIDPSDALANELYQSLTEHRLLNETGKPSHRFFISVPNPDLKSNILDENGAFPFSYKYGRSINSGLMFVKRVPISRQWLSENIIERIRVKMPGIHRLIFEPNQ